MSLQQEQNNAKHIADKLHCRWSLWQRSQAQLQETTAWMISCLKKALQMQMLAQKGSAGLPSLCAHIAAGS